MLGPGFHAHQMRFHQRWPELRDPHVRALAWLLYAPDLLAPEAACWEGRIASLGVLSPEVAGWLHDLQYDPALNAALHAHMAQQPSARLGRYAEKLLGFYLRQQDCLVAANLQVHNQGPKRETLGEFDFLVRSPEAESDGGVVHWEFATKFYLLQGRDSAARQAADAFVGPNLADSLGRKMRKIMQHQLMLSSHPAAQAVLPAPVVAARALVKGWLFYRQGEALVLPPAMGIAADHCRGFWCDASGLQALDDGSDDKMRYALLPRLSWLAPARLPPEQGMSLTQLLLRLEEMFRADDNPVMVAQCRLEQGAQPELLETARAFIVPPQWEARAADTVRHAILQV
ncbi:DUF1853 family protein [Herbaspirillum rubrisubalbicans]|uniref:DUF1853 domain-containing protein n=1 Tax=Herbaspirillum rubrisubalbicans TaxID=80842 RepID=A0AAD0U724_9BURK|nr:DUF1853 family protein [Herbaspirillum rubrisubalbicans]AYR24284.1 DUF1853 domain-containing protein [Herbaspirillum rubrisubalbicans]